MSNIFRDGDMDAVIQYLDDKIVRDEGGDRYIRVEDLMDLQRQVKEMEAENRERPKPKTMAEARISAMADPALQTLPPSPRAPALSGVKGVNEEGDRRDVA